MENSMIKNLPPLSYLSPSAISFLDSKHHAGDDLQQAPSLLLELQTECHNLDQSLLDLNQKLQNSLIAYASHGDRIGVLFGYINAQLINLQSSTCVSGSSSDGGSEHILGEELPALAKEVARVETVRMYADIRKNERRVLGETWNELRAYMKTERDRAE
ncbi:unnamed protein product [Ilex paraguariensis]|uniref:Uncharacterized protein n=1 Tax=Ilex paraguariensis TaxID=185542 RepID=A0ABC8SM56_9AQUA